MNILNFNYANHAFVLKYNVNDSSGIGSVMEIVDRNDYVLNKFINQDNKIFFDIGANLGVATIIMGKLNPNSVIYSFEPLNDVYNMLIENIKINNLNNVKAFNCAISNKTIDNIQIRGFNKCSGSSTIYAIDCLFNEFYNNDINIQTTRCFSFDDFLEMNNINEILLLKIDCEGAEYDIIYDSQKIKQYVIKNIVGEFHDLKYNNTPKNQCDILLEYCNKYINGIKQVSFLKI